MPFLSPNQQCHSTEGKISHSMDLLTPSSLGGLPTLSLTTNSSWLLNRNALLHPFLPFPLPFPPLPFYLSPILLSPPTFLSSSSFPSLPLSPSPSLPFPFFAATGSGGLKPNVFWCLSCIWCAYYGKIDGKQPQLV